MYNLHILTLSSLKVYIPQVCSHFRMAKVTIYDDQNQVVGEVDPVYNLDIWDEESQSFNAGNPEVHLGITKLSCNYVLIMSEEGDAYGRVITALDAAEAIMDSGHLELFETDFSELIEAAKNLSVEEIVLKKRIISHGHYGKNWAIVLSKSDLNQMNLKIGDYIDITRNDVQEPVILTKRITDVQGRTSSEIRLSKQDLEKLGLQAGDLAEFRIKQNIF